MRKVRAPEKERWITSSGGDSKESATEIDRLLLGKDGKVR